MKIDLPTMATQTWLFSHFMANIHGLFSPLKLSTEGLPFDVHSPWTMEKFASLKFHDKRIRSALWLPSDYYRGIAKFRKMPNFLYCDSLVGNHISDTSRIPESPEIWTGRVDEFIRPLHSTVWHNPEWRTSKGFKDDKVAYNVKIRGVDPSRNPTGAWGNQLEDDPPHIWWKEAPEKVLERMETLPFESKKMRNVMIEFENVHLDHGVFTPFGATVKRTRFVGVHVMTEKVYNCIKPKEKFNLFLEREMKVFLDQKQSEIRDNLRLMVMREETNTTQYRLHQEELEKCDQMREKYPTLPLQTKLHAWVCNRVMRIHEDGLNGLDENDPVLDKLLESVRILMDTFSEAVQKIVEDTWDKNEHHFHECFHNKKRFHQWTWESIAERIIHMGYIPQLLETYTEQWQEFLERDTTEIIRVCGVFEQKVQSGKGQIYYLPYIVNMDMPNNSFSIVELMSTFSRCNSPEFTPLFWKTYAVYRNLCEATENKVVITQRIKVDQPKKRKKAKSKRTRRKSYYHLKIDIPENARVIVNKTIERDTPITRGKMSGHERRLGKLGFRWVLEENAHPDETWFDIRERVNASGKTSVLVLVQRTIGKGVIKVNGGYEEDSEEENKIRRGRLKAF